MTEAVDLFTAVEPFAPELCELALEAVDGWLELCLSDSVLELELIWMLES